MFASTDPALSPDLPVLTPDELARIEATLHDQRRFRLAQIRVLTADAGRAEDAEIRRAVLDAATAALRDTEAALGRLGDGSYGTCLDCGRALSAERLRVLPQSPRCTSCGQARA